MKGSEDPRWKEAFLEEVALQLASKSGAHHPGTFIWVSKRLCKYQTLLVG